jgi:cytidylate kinase
MDEVQQALSGMRAITISREYGSGGGEIAMRLARRLGWRLVDHEVIAQVARELEVHETAVEAHDEYVEGRIAGILNRLRLRAPGGLTPSAVGSPVGTPLITATASPEGETRAYQEALRHVVQAAANTGHVVIVGRGGQVILADRRDVLHVRVVAPLAQRVAYVARREGLDEAAARTRVQTKDRARTRYMQTQYHCQHDDPHLYDLVVNTGVLDLDSAVDLIALALARKASRLSVPVTELGPAAGLARYAGQPADFPVPPQRS